jgi:hypothetical protein
MAEKGNGQHIATVNDNNHAETNLEQGNSKFREEAKRIQSLGSVRLRNENTGEIVLVPTPTKDPNDPLVLPLPLFTADRNRIGLVLSNMQSRSWYALLSFSAISSLQGQLSLLSRLPKPSSLSRQIRTWVEVSQKLLISLRLPRWCRFGPRSLFLCLYLGSQ